MEMRCFVKYYLDEHRLQRIKKREMNRRDGRTKDKVAPMLYAPINEYVWGVEIKLHAF
jgi:hypothetical protein